MVAYMQRSWMTVAGVVLVTAVWAGSCKRAPVDDGPTVAALCAAVSAPICAGLSACDCRFDVRPYDEQGCVEARTDACVDQLGGAVQADLDAGTARLSDAAISACVAAIDAMAATCSLGESGGLPAACDALVIATANLGEPCGLSGGGLAFCADGAGFCDPTDGAPQCVTLPAPGEACPFGQCAAGATCDSTGACVPIGAAGDACDDERACQAGLVCDGANQCSPPLSDGATCTRHLQCQVGSDCATGQCAPATTIGGACDDPSDCGVGRSCGRDPASRTCGDADQLGEPCRDGSCASGLSCSFSDQVCVALPGLDEPCLDGFACAAGLTCADGVGTCVTLPGPGETCAAGARFCADGFGCDFDTNTCAPPAAAGEECLLNPPDYVCEAGLGCDFGATGSVCQPLTGAGSACNSDRTCTASTYCDYGTLTCAERLADGAPCSAGNECGLASTCAPAPAGYQCAPLPKRDEPCVDVCGDGLTCTGAGGECVAALCVIP